MEVNKRAPFSLISIIIQRGQGSRVVAYARKHGSSGGTIIPAHGTAAKRWLKRFHFDDIDRDLVLMLVRDDCETQLMDGLNEAFRFDDSNTGIAFSLPVSHALGTSKVLFDTDISHLPCDNLQETAYRAVFAIVNEEDSDDAIDIVRSTGAPGATYARAFGSADPTKLIFNVPSSAEKTFILIVADNDKATEIIAALSAKLAIDKPGHGIVFSTPVQHVRGMAQREMKS